ncbi:MAG: PHP domain-containing protein [bacterium]
MKIDCHTHTTPYSSCSTLSPDELLKRARNSGLDGLVLTEHEVFWSADHFCWLKQAFPELSIFWGVETDVGPLGHVVVIPPAPDAEILRINSPGRLTRYLDKNGGFAFVAHPFRFNSKFGRDIDRYNLPGVEVASFNMHEPSAVRQALEFAREHDASPLATSDAHSLPPVGKYYIELEEETGKQTELIKILNKRSWRPFAPVLEQLEGEKI